MAPFLRCKFGLETISSRPWKISQLSQIRDIGKCMLIEMFYKTILSKFSGIDAAKAEEPIGEYGEDYLIAISSLKLTVDLGYSNVVIY